MSLRHSERRNHPRYLAPQLSVSLLSINPKTANGKNTLTSNETQIQLKTVDFNHLGMSVYSSQHFNIGDVLHLLISDENNRSQEVHCFVCNRARTDLGYRSGLHFLNAESDMTGTNNIVSGSLLAIERSLDMIHE